MRPKFSSGDRSRRRLLLGLAVIAVIFLAEDGLGALLTRSANADAREIYATSLSSVEQVSRIARGLDQERVLVNDHIFASDAGNMAAIERRLSAVAVKLHQYESDYVPLVRLPNEAGLWRDAQGLKSRFDAEIASVLALSRENQDVEARVRMVAAQKTYADLDSKLVALIRLNLAGARGAMDRIGALQRRTEAAQWGARIAGLLALLLFGIWGARRILGYEKQITGYTLEIEERNRDLDAFAGRVAHDLRNALGPIAMSPFMLRQSAGRSERVHEIADRIDRCSNRTVALLDALLAFSRASRRAEANESGALRPAIRSVQEELASLASHLDVSVHIENIPDVRLRCNSGLLHIVLANLLGNAVKYLDGQKERRVRISACQEESMGRIQIEDTGPGIPKDVQGKIFDPFFRVEGTPARGTGIGLATVRRIVEGRGGRVAVDSDKGRGSRFIVWLPLAQSSDDRSFKAGPEESRPALHE